MFKSTANAQQMLMRTGNHSTKGSAKGFVDGIGENAAVVLDENERRESRRRSIEAELAQLRIQLREQKQESNRLLHARQMAAHIESIEKCNAIKARMSTLQAEVPRLNPNSRRLPSSLIERAFVDICKETMTKAQFDMTIRKAMDRVRANGGSNESR